jgi:AraC family transcriptional regulator
MSVAAKALWYIDGHLRGDLSLNAIADAAGVSRFHLSRAFAVTTGQSLSAYTRARRLSEAAKAIAAGAPSLLDVALEAGYGSHEAFTRAFRQHFGITPDELRGQGLDHLPLQELIRMNEPATVTLAPPRIVPRDAMLISGLSQRYNYSNAGMASQWERFVPHLGHIPGQVGSAAYGVIYNGDEAGCDYMTGVEVSQFAGQPPEFARLRIPEQTYAVFEHRDHISSINATWQAIWNNALPQSGYKAADGPSFERYDERFDGRTGLGGLEIWIPIHA